MRGRKTLQPRPVPQQALHAARRKIRFLEKLLAVAAPEVAARLPQIRAAARACDSADPQALRLAIESGRGIVQHQLPYGSEPPPGISSSDETGER
jgi:hypothetical protein